MFSNKNKLPIIGIVVVLIIFLASLFVINQVGPYDRKSSKEVVVEIPSGSTVTDVANILYENKLIKSKDLFKIVGKVSKEGSNIKAGKYLLMPKYSNAQILDILVTGKTYNDGIKVTIPEGYTSKEIIDILVNKKLGDKEVYKKLIESPEEFYEKYSFLKENDIVNLEGFLYPDTYYFDRDLSEKEILSAMLNRFNKIYTDEFNKKQKEMDMTLQQVVNLASIVEKEAVLDEDRPIIASVFYNRLDIDMPLQSDATIQYIFEERKKIVTYNDLKIDSPYNSYLNKGLPPTPIANPGVKSIEATLYPEKTEYLYFVATIEGGNNYSKTYEEHLRYVDQYKKDRDKLNQEK